MKTNRTVIYLFAIPLLTASASLPVPPSALGMLPTQAQGDDGAAPAAEIVPCPEGVVSGFTEVEGETVVCGIVSAPANYDEPDGAQIDLVYGILRSTSLAPAADPVIYLHGGPGMSELTTLTQGLQERFMTLRQRRDVIVFDQRGAGFSSGEVNCEAIHEAGSDAAFEDARKELGEDAPPYAVSFVANQAVYGDCVEALTAEGVDLAQYNTVNNARDVAALADAPAHDVFLANEVAH